MAVKAVLLVGGAQKGGFTTIYLLETNNKNIKLTI